MAEIFSGERPAIGIQWLRACFKNRPVRGPGLQGFVILAISRTPRALTRRPPTILKHALAVALCACVSRFVRLVVMNVNSVTFAAKTAATDANDLTGSDFVTITLTLLFH